MELIFEGDGIPEEKRDEIEKALRQHLGISLAAMDSNRALIHMRHASISQAVMQNIANEISQPVAFAISGPETERVVNGRKYIAHEKGFWREAESK